MYDCIILKNFAINIVYLNTIGSYLIYIFVLNETYSFKEKAKNPSTLIK